MTTQNDITPVVLDNHGERMVPSIAGTATFWEHVGRYRFAVQHVRGKRVLDIACGEGYGSSALLRGGAASVIGIDVSEMAVTHARRTYGIDARVGDALAIPLPDHSIDVVVSFETIEHVSDPDRFMNEIARVLVANGSAVISTPVRDVYRHGEAENEFHLSEMTVEEFLEKLSTHFRSFQLFGQCTAGIPWYSPRLMHADFRQLRLAPGLSRFRRALQAMINPRVLTEPSETMRRHPVETILANESSFAGYFSQYRVRAWHAGEVPMYLVGIAQR